MGAGVIAPRPEMAPPEVRRSIRVRRRGLPDPAMEQPAVRNDTAPTLTVQRLLDHLAAGKPALDFAETPGISTLANLSLARYGTDLNIATFKRLLFDGCCLLSKYMDGEDHDGIYAVAVTELAVILRRAQSWWGHRKA